MDSPQVYLGWDDISFPAGPAGCARVQPLGAGWGQTFLCLQGREEAPRPLLGLAPPLCSQPVGLARHPIPLHCAPAIQAGKSWDFLLASDAPLMLAPLGWWQWAVPEPPGLACSWEAPCRVAGLLLTQIYSPWRGGWGRVPRLPWLREMGKPCHAQGWPGSTWHRPCLTAHRPEPAVW